ncbi:MAG: hypothetical protein P8N50_06415 [Actinomycetota bacterium]|jgi:hypothetical protein|nr:hypothetical protein [Actinomycetota bacterium]
MSSGQPIPELAEMGFELQAVLRVDDLPSWAVDPLATGVSRVGMRGRLVMLGQGGRSLWNRMEGDKVSGKDLFDDFSIESVRAWMQAQHPDGSHEVVYPGDTPIPLGRLAEHVGWGRPSPLGLSIHHRFGPWIAHRIVFLTDVDLPPTSTEEHDHPCDTCVGRPCVSACPARAVGETGNFDITSCAAHRIEDGSKCALQCIARNACPVGADHRYGDAQMQHHYRSGLDSIRKWVLR